MVLIGFARLYVAVHSMNQIIYGWQLGIWLALYFHYCIREPLHLHIIYIYESDVYTHSHLHFLLASGIFLMAYFSQILTYILVNVSQKPDPAWAEQIYLKCEKIKPGTGFVFNDLSVVMSGLTCFAYSSYLGVLAHRKLYGRFWTPMLKTSIAKSLLRLIILALMVLPFALPFLIAF